jgi:flavin-dependent dehydrogenase
VIGVGGAGSDIAERAAAVGMRVIGVDPKDIAPTAAVQRIVPPDMLLEVLPQANVQNSTVKRRTPAMHHSSSEQSRPQWQTNSRPRP